MKIGVITQPLHSNYGGLLQAYALQMVLTKMGHEAIVLDRHPVPPTWKDKALAPVKTAVFRCLGRQKNRLFFPFFPTDAQKETITHNTSVFIHEHIKKTKNIYSTNVLRRVVAEEHLDAIMVGSDQVWRPSYSNVKNCFLDFLDKSSQVRRVAYAASFGVNKWMFNPKLTHKCAQLAQRFDAISVREDSGVELCNEFLGVEAVHVLDPTLLLEPDDYRSLVIENNQRQNAGNLMTYILDPSVKKNTAIQQVAKKLNLTPFSVMPSIKLNHETQDRLNDCVFPRVSQWLSGYRDAKFVVTDSFHGCVFSILFNIPFIAIGNKQRGMTRFNSLLRQFNLTERLISSPDDLTYNLIQERINWDKVNKIHSKLKIESLGFLIENLK